LTIRFRESYSSVSMSVNYDSARLKKPNSNWLKYGKAVITFQQKC